MRLDKLLAHVGMGSRKEVKKTIASGEVTVNGEIIKDSGCKVDPDHDKIMYLSHEISYQEFFYVMLNKPAGIVSATDDNVHETVIDWVSLDYGHARLFPVGRLDIDTTGLLLLTNDGQLAHRLISPKHQVSKRYEAVISGLVNAEDIQTFKKGIDLGDFMTLPAGLEVISQDEINHLSRVIVDIQEGKFHQVKRMFQAVGNQVIELHRIQMGSLLLDPDLSLGDYRELTKDERDCLIKHS